VRPRTTDRRLRYALIAVAIGACLFLAWLSLAFLLEELQPTPPFDPEHPNIVWPEDDYTLVGVLVTSALVMAAAAGGMIARRSEGAYLLLVGALMCAIPLAALSLLTLSAWDVASDPGPVRLLGPVALGLDLWVAALAKRLGGSMQLDNGPTRPSA